jgi:hypothetical protein
LKLKLFVRPEKNAYIDRDGNRKSGTKHVLGLELAIDHVRQLPSPAGDAFDHVRQQLEGRVIKVEDPEGEQAPAVHAEFYPASSIKPSSATANGRPTEKDEATLGDKEKELCDRIEEAFADLRLTTAQRQGLLDQHRDDPQALLDRLTRAIEKRKAEQAQNGTGTDQQVVSQVSKNGSARSPVNGQQRRTQSNAR